MIAVRGFPMRAAGNNTPPATYEISIFMMQSAARGGAKMNMETVRSNIEYRSAAALSVFGVSRSIARIETAATPYGAYPGDARSRLRYG